MYYICLVCNERFGTWLCEEDAVSWGQSNYPGLFQVVKVHKVN